MLVFTPATQRLKSTEHQRVRALRIGTVSAQLPKHAAKAALRTAEQDRLDTLLRMLTDVRSEHAQAIMAGSERAQHLGQAALDLETMIARAFLKRDQA